ncbi:MAG: DUF624 domain-containing protein [Clostridia bacterium]|nr:DUF624 domain-containing protein [Clostridia bacterium]NLV33281.1 DUF624 domain-containing protein [Clostridiaceae bacterium]HPB16162.1 hypothetical protein [Clostridia bacterium]HQM96272.1 hypothetical protein [Clostridia bacterium]HQO69476.1 hypothetical protein [Clostridia bacterium]
MNSRKKTNYEDQKPKESKFMKFMDILKIRFWSIAKFNLICLGIYTIFIVFYAFFISQIFFPIDVSDYQQGYSNFGELLALLVYRIPYTLIFFTVPIVAFGPAASAIAVVFRSYVRRDDSFSSDFTDGFKKYFWKSLAVTGISTVITICLGIAFRFYQLNLQAGFWKTALLLIIAGFSVLFVMMHMYIYQILVEYNLSIWKLYRYSYVFAILRFFPNLLIAAGIIALTILPFLIHILFGAVVMIAVLFGLSSYIINFFTWPALEKHLDPIMKEQKINKVKLY